MTRLTLGALFAFLAIVEPVGAVPPLSFTDLATPFEQVAISTTEQPEAVRVAAVRHAIDPLLRDVYPDNDRINRRIAGALASFPADQDRYDRTVHAFPFALNSAVSRFRTVFPGFSPPLPIYLYHSLGMRDGGSDYLGPEHRRVMFFGADLIAKLHSDDSLEPFLDHELFHLEHAHAFSDCDQFWCAVWQEGLAVDAAATMTPGATDHQLLLDVPGPIRGPTDRRWAEALCFVALHFDDTDEVTVAQALQGGGRPVSGLPERFGYYAGLRLAQATGRSIVALDHLNNEAARPLLRKTLIRMMADAHATCAPPAASGRITHRMPHPV